MSSSLVLITTQVWLIIVSSRQLFQYCQFILKMQSSTFLAVLICCTILSTQKCQVISFVVVNLQLSENQKIMSDKFTLTQYMSNAQYCKLTSVVLVLSVINKYAMKNPYLCFLLLLHATQNLQIPHMRDQSSSRGIVALIEKEKENIFAVIFDVVFVGVKYPLTATKHILANF